MTKRHQLYLERKVWLKKHWQYKMLPYDKFNYKLLNNIMYQRRSGQGHNGETYNDIIIMADTETSKEHAGTQCKNYVVAWTISLRAFNTNLVTLYGHKPSEMVECINKMKEAMQGDKTVIYWHNMSYDWVFVRKFFMAAYGLPEHQLNIKSHYPLFITWENGLIMKDSLILAQRKLEKWANDLNVEHKKAVGKWDYNKKRSQNDVFTADELEYIECDTLAGVECIQATMDALGKHIYSMPYTATGIPREEVQKRAKNNRGRDRFKKVCPDYLVYRILEQVYHGGYTHANRHILGLLIDDVITRCYDFASSYPYVMLAEKFPVNKFAPYGEAVDIDFILKNANKYGFIFKLILIKPRLKDDFISMPALQYSKAVKTVNAVQDNGRILCAELVEIYLNEIDLKVINEQYTYDAAAVMNVYYSKKDYLPRWLTDYVFQCFEDKCKLKHGDPVLYSIAKARLNSIYGMCCQKCIREVINEDYQTGEYSVDEAFNPVEEYEKYKNKYTSVLPYQYGVWVTSYAFYNLFQLGKCCKNWYYSDTDSCYGSDWDEKKLQRYNNECKKKLLKNNYGPVTVNGEEFWLGIATLDGEYEEFVTVGAKRYACRYAGSHEVKITVAGVPKKNGAKCLNNDLHNFRKDFCFDGETTGKMQHTYYFEPDIWIDEDGNERGDSIDLSPTSYILDTVEQFDWEKLFMEEIELQVYEEE